MENCIILLPADVRYKDVLDVISIFCGDEKFSEIDGYLYVKNTSVDFKTFDFDPSFFKITIGSNPIDKEFHYGFFHYESVRGLYREIHGYNNEFWHRLGDYLISFFGGFVDYNDCDSIEVDNYVKKPRISNSHESDEEFDKFYRDMAKLEGYKK